MAILPFMAILVIYSFEYENSYSDETNLCLNFIHVKKIDRCHIKNTKPDQIIII